VIQHNDTNTTSVIKSQLLIQAEQDKSHKRTYDAISEMHTSMQSSSAQGVANSTLTKA
jgi:hypothetical protein